MGVWDTYKGVYQLSTNRRLAFIFLCVFSTPFASGADSEPNVIAIRAGRILPVSGEPIKDGIILIEKGKITALGTDVIVPRDVRMIDAQDKTVVPGLIDAQSQLFLIDSERTLRSGAPELEVLDAIDPFNKDYLEVLAQGVTAVCVVPATRSNWTGKCPVLRLNKATTVKQRVLKSAGAVKASIGLSGRNNESSSLERLGHYAGMREAFISAQRYLRRWEEYEHDLAEYKKEKGKTENKEKPGEGQDKPPVKRSSGPKKPVQRPRKPAHPPSNEVLAAILRKDIPLRIEAHRVDDILHALRLAEEFKFNLILEKCTEGYRIAPKIAKAKVPVIAGPMTTSLVSLPSVAYERYNPANPALLSNNGIQLALGTGAQDGLGSKFLASGAALAVSHGMDPDMALRAVTLTAAEILGVADRIGSLDVGKDADLVICLGHPFNSFTKVETVMIQGKIVYKRKGAK